MDEILLGFDTVATYGCNIDRVKSDIQTRKSYSNQQMLSYNNILNYIPGCGYPIYMKHEGSCDNPTLITSLDGFEEELGPASGDVNDVDRNNYIAENLCFPENLVEQNRVSTCSADARITTTSGAQGEQPRPARITLDDIKSKRCPEIEQITIESAQMAAGVDTQDEIPDVFRKYYYWMACNPRATGKLYNPIGQNPKLPVSGDNPTETECDWTPDRKCEASSICLEHNPDAAEMGMGPPPLPTTGRDLCDDASALSTSECGFCDSVDWQMDFDTLKEIQCSQSLGETEDLETSMSPSVSYYAKNGFCDPNFGVNMMLYTTGEDQCMQDYPDAVGNTCQRLATTEARTCNWCSDWLNDDRSTIARQFCNPLEVQDTGFFDPTINRNRYDCYNYINQATQNPVYYGSDPNAAVASTVENPSPSQAFSDVCNALFDPNKDGSGGMGCDLTCGFCGNR